MKNLGMSTPAHAFHWQIIFSKAVANPKCLCYNTFWPIGVKCREENRVCLHLVAQLMY